MLTAMGKIKAFRSISRVVLLAAIAGTLLAGCGVKSTPKFPKDTKYPRQYPEPLPPLTGVPQPEKPASGSNAQPAPSGIYQYPNPQSYTPPKE
jgi:predicted small lipoprotein YifL